MSLLGEITFRTEKVTLSIRSFECIICFVNLAMKLLITLQQLSAPWQEMCPCPWVTILLHRLIVISAMLLVCTSMLTVVRDPVVNMRARVPCLLADLAGLFCLISFLLLRLCRPVATAGRSSLRATRRRRPADGLRWHRRLTTVRWPVRPIVADGTGPTMHFPCPVCCRSRKVFYHPSKRSPETPFRSVRQKSTIMRRPGIKIFGPLVRERHHV